LSWIFSSSAIAFFEIGPWPASIPRTKRHCQAFLNYAVAIVGTGQLGPSWLKSSFCAASDFPPLHQPRCRNLPGMRALAPQSTWKPATESLAMVRGRPRRPGTLERPVDRRSRYLRPMCRRAATSCNSTTAHAQLPPKKFATIGRYASDAFFLWAHTGDRLLHAVVTSGGLISGSFAIAFRTLAAPAS